MIASAPFMLAQTRTLLAETLRTEARRFDKASQAAFAHIECVLDFQDNDYLLAMVGELNQAHMALLELAQWARNLEVSERTLIEIEMYEGDAYGRWIEAAEKVPPRMR